MYEQYELDLGLSKNKNVLTDRQTAADAGGEG